MTPATAEAITVSPLMVMPNQCQIGAWWPTWIAASARRLSVISGSILSSSVVGYGVGVGLGAKLPHAIVGPSQISDAVATTWTGLAQLYRNKYGTRYSPKALAADIDRAHARYTEHPLQISHTSATPPRGGSGAAAAARTHLRRFAAAIDLAIAADRWGRRSFGAEIVLMAEDLRAAARALGRITGAVDVEDVLDRIFAEFCIGK